MKSAHMDLKHPENQHANICGNVVLNITPSSDWYVSHLCNLRRVLVIYLHWDHVFGTGELKYN
jgi:hypothetical protein